MDVGVYFFGQKKVAEEGPQHQTSKHHLIIFWGFLIITVATIDIFVSGVWPGVSLQLLPSVIYQPLYLVIDCFNGLVLLMIVWAFARRIIVKPRLIPMNLDAGLILGGIGALMISHFLFHAYEIAASGESRWWLPISNVIASGLPANHSGYVIGYWLHVLILLTFLNYLPYSKHIHL